MKCPPYDVRCPECGKRKCLDWWCERVLWRRWMPGIETLERIGLWADADIPVNWPLVD